MLGDARRALGGWWWVAAAAAVAIAYAPALRGGFVFDDHVLVESSELLRGPLWKIWFSAEPVDWWPLTYTSLWLEWRAFGTSPAGYHAVGVVLHAASAVLLGLALRAWGIRGARLAALLFALHPVAVESVAWISERKNTLSAVFFWGALLAWERFDRTSRERDRLVACGLLAAALLAKASTVMLPVVVLLATWWRHGAIRRRDLARVAPLLALALAVGLVTIWFQTSHAMQGFVSPRGLAERVGGAAWALCTYLRTAFLPIGVAFVYPKWPLPPTSPGFYAPIALVLVAALALWRWRSPARRPVAAALAYHALLVLPVLGFVEMAYFHFGPVANHLQYLALAGPCALVAAGAHALLGGARPWLRATGAVSCLAAVAALAGATRTRAAAFEDDDLTLWRAAAREAPGSLSAAWMYADKLGERGRPAEALAELARVARDGADERTRLSARAVHLVHLGRFDEAAAAMRAAEAIQHDPDVLVEVGSLLTRSGAAATAVPLLEPLVRRAPRSLQYRYTLASALARSGRDAAAAEVLAPACGAEQRSARTCEALAAVLSKLGRADEARTALRLAREP